MKGALEQQLADWGNADANGDEDSDEEPPRKGLPEKKKKKLLDAKTWERDARLVETGHALRKVLAIAQERGMCHFVDGPEAQAGHEVCEAAQNALGVADRARAAPAEGHRL